MLDIENIVYSRLKNKYQNQLKNKYPNIAFTTSDRNAKEATFPNVYIHELGSRETGGCLEGDAICAVDSTIQIVVTDNASPQNTKYVMDRLVDGMKGMLYQVTMMPVNDNSSSVYIRIARFSRVIGSGDTL